MRSKDAVLQLASPERQQIQPGEHRRGIQVELEAGVVVRVDEYELMY
jgi:hypothetical protein